MKINWTKIREQIKNTDKSVLLKIAGSVDGHTIYDPKHFTQNGLDQTIVDAFTKTLRSGNNPKEQIYDKTNNIVPAMQGVHGLEVLEFIASVFNVSSWKMGRGSRAAHLSEQLTEKLTVPSEK